MFAKRFVIAILALGLGLAACAPAPGTAIPTASATLLPSPSPTITITPLAWEGERLPGVDQGLTGELFTLPQDVFGMLREKGGAAIELTNGVVGGAGNGLCSVAIAEQLTTGSQLQADGEGPAVYAFDGRKDQLAFWQNLPVPEGVSCVAFVAQDGNKWGLESGTVAVWFFTSGGKAGSTVINADNPLRIMISADNSGQLSFANNTLTMTTLDASGQIIEEQKVSFLPPLPSEFLSQIPADKQYQIVNGQVMVDNQAWFELKNNEWHKTDWKLLADAPKQEFWRDRYKMGEVLRQQIRPVLTGENLEMTKGISGQAVLIKGRLAVIPNPYELDKILKIFIPYRYEWGNGLSHDAVILDYSNFKNMKHLDFFLQLPAGEQLYMPLTLDSSHRPAVCTFGTDCGWWYDTADFSADFFLKGVALDEPMIVSPVDIGVKEYLLFP